MSVACRDSGMEAPAGVRLFELGAVPFSQGMFAREAAHQVGACVNRVGDFLTLRDLPIMPADPNPAFGYVFVELFYAKGRGDGTPPLFVQTVWADEGTYGRCICVREGDQPHVWRETRRNAEARTLPGEPAQQPITVEVSA